MSWDAYVKQLINSNHIKLAAICGHDGSTWASSDGFCVKPKEISDALQVLKGSKPDFLHTNPFMVGGVKYVYLRSEEGTCPTILGRKGDDGVIIALTTKAVVVSVYGPGQNAGNANNATGKIAEYLVGVGY